MVNIIKIILLYENVEHQQIIEHALRDDTKIIKVYKNDTYGKILTEIRKNGISTLEYLGLMYKNENDDGTKTLQKMPILNLGESFFGTEFINLINLLKSTAVRLKYIDLLTCNIYRENDKKEINKLESLFEINFRYSLDMTGPVSRGGDWILESDNVNIKNVYFTDYISNYPQLLGVTDNFYILESAEFYDESSSTFSPSKHHLYFKYNNGAFQPWTKWNEKMDADLSDNSYLKSISYEGNKICFLDGKGDVFLFDKSRFMVDDVYDLSNIALPTKVDALDLSGSSPYQSIKIGKYEKDGDEIFYVVYIDAEGHLFKSELNNNLDISRNSALRLDDDITPQNKYFFVSNTSDQKFMAIDVSHNFRAFDIDNSHNPVTNIDDVDLSSNFINFNKTLTFDISNAAILNHNKKLRRVAWDSTPIDLSDNACTTLDIMHYDGAYNDMYFIDTDGFFKYWDGTTAQTVQLKTRENQNVYLISFDINDDIFYLMTSDYLVYEVTRADVESSRSTHQIILSPDNHDNYRDDGNNKIYYEPISVLQDGIIKYAIKFKPFQNTALRSNGHFEFEMYKSYGDTFQELLMTNYKPTFSDHKDIIYPDFAFPPESILENISFTDFNYGKRVIAGDLIVPFTCDVKRKSTPNFLATSRDIFKVVDITLYGVKDSDVSDDTKKELSSNNLFFKVDRRRLSNLKSPFSKNLNDVNNVVVYPAEISASSYVKHGDASTNINLRNLHVEGILSFKKTGTVENNIFPLLFVFNFTMFKKSFTFRKDFVDTDLGIDGNLNEIKMYDVVFPRTINPDRYTFDNDAFSEKVSRILRIELFNVTTYGALKIYKRNDPSGNDADLKARFSTDGERIKPELTDSSYKLIDTIPLSTIEANKKEKPENVWYWDYVDNEWKERTHTYNNELGYSENSNYYYDYYLNSEDVKDYERFALHISVEGSQGHRYHFPYSNDISRNVATSYERMLNSIPILDGEANIPYSVTTTKIGEFAVSNKNLDNDIHNFAGCAIELKIRGGEEGKFKMYNRYTKQYTNIEDFYEISYVYEIYYYSHFDPSSNVIRSDAKSYDNKLFLVKTLEGVKSTLTYEFKDEDVDNWYTNATSGNDAMSHSKFNSDISGVLSNENVYGCKGFFVSVKYKYLYRFANYDDSNPIDLAYHQRSFEQDIYYLPPNGDTLNYLKDTFAPIKYTSIGSLYNLNFETVGSGNSIKWETDQKIRREDIETEIERPITSNIINDIKYSALHLGRGLYHDLDGVNENAIICENTIDLEEKDDPDNVTDLSKNFNIIIEVSGDISDNSIPGTIIEVDISYGAYKDISDNNGEIPLFQYYYDISGPYGYKDDRIDWRDISGSMLLSKASQFSNQPGKWCLKNKIQNLITPVFRIITYQNRFYKGDYESVNINEVKGTFSLNLPSDEIFDNSQNIIGFHFYWGDKDNNVISKFQDLSKNILPYNSPGSFVSFKDAFYQKDGENKLTFTISETEINGTGDDVTYTSISKRIPYNYEKIIIYVELFDGIHPVPYTFDIFQRVKVDSGNLYDKDISSIKILDTNNNNETDDDLSYNKVDYRTNPVKLRIFHDVSYATLSGTEDYYLSFYWGIKPEGDNVGDVQGLIKRHRLNASELSDNDKIYEDVSLNSLTLPSKSETEGIPNAIFVYYSKKVASDNYIENINTIGVPYLNVVEAPADVNNVLTLDAVRATNGGKRSFNLNDVSSNITFELDYSMPVTFKAGSKLIMNNGGEAMLIDNEDVNTPNTIKCKYDLNINDIGTTMLQIKKLEGKIFAPNKPQVHFIKDNYWKKSELNLPTGNVTKINIISNRIDKDADNRLDNVELKEFIEQQIFNQKNI